MRSVQFCVTLWSERDLYLILCNPSRGSTPNVYRMYITSWACLTGLTLSLEGNIAARRTRLLPRERLDLVLRTVFTGCYPATAVPAAALTPTAQSIKFLVAGAIGGVVSRTLVSPLEVVATVNMVSRRRSPVSCQAVSPRFVGLGGSRRWRFRRTDRALGSGRYFGFL